MQTSRLGGVPTVLAPAGASIAQLSFDLKDDRPGTEGVSRPLPDVVHIRG